MSSVPASNESGVQHANTNGPRHIAIIMDGNGRWAQQRGLPRTAGHERGVEALRRTVEAAGDLSVEYLTVFSFSTENWRRPASEISALFGLLKAYVKRDLERLTREGVRVRVLGNRVGVPDDVAELIEKAESQTAHNTARFLNIAFNYGGREEITRAAKVIASRLQAGDISADQIDEALITDTLDSRGIPDPDVVIRTSGEYRLSNFLLWQAAYAELIFTDVLWPDFRKADLEAAICVFRKRDRRYGAAASESR